MKKFATLLLAAALIGNSMDLSVLTVNAAEKEKTLICEKEEHTHDEKCYAEAAQKKSITAWTWNDEAKCWTWRKMCWYFPVHPKNKWCSIMTS